jgi:alkylation response protein AidB-like acyl-CoA dehydrogenase
MSESNRPGPTVEPSDDVEQFRCRARAWLESVANYRAGRTAESSNSLAVFANVNAATERAQTDAGRRWERMKFDAGWGALSWPTSYGGRALPKYYDLVFADEEAQFDAPAHRAHSRQVGYCRAA